MFQQHKNVDMTEELNKLLEIFTSIDKDIVQEVLVECEGDVNAATDKLLELTADNRHDVSEQHDLAVIACSLLSQESFPVNDADVSVPLTLNILPEEDDSYENVTSKNVVIDQSNLLANEAKALKQSNSGQTDHTDVDRTDIKRETTLLQLQSSCSVSEHRGYRGAEIPFIASNFTTPHMLDDSLNFRHGKISSRKEKLSSPARKVIDVCSYDLKIENSTSVDSPIVTVLQMEDAEPAGELLHSGITDTPFDTSTDSTGHRVNLGSSKPKDTLDNIHSTRYQPGPHRVTLSAERCECAQCPGLFKQVEDPSQNYSSADSFRPSRLPKASNADSLQPFADLATNILTSSPMSFGNDVHTDPFQGQELNVRSEWDKYYQNLSLDPLDDPFIPCENVVIDKYLKGSFSQSCNSSFLNKEVIHKEEKPEQMKNIESLLQREGSQGDYGCENKLFQPSDDCGHLQEEGPVLMQTEATPSSRSSRPDVTPDHSSSPTSSLSSKNGTTHKQLSPLASEFIPRPLALQQSLSNPHKQSSSVQKKIDFSMPSPDKSIEKPPPLQHLKGVPLLKTGLTQGKKKKKNPQKKTIDKRNVPLSKNPSYCDPESETTPAIVENIFDPTDPLAFKSFCKPHISSDLKTKGQPPWISNNKPQKSTKPFTHSSKFSSPISSTGTLEEAHTFHSNKSDLSSPALTNKASCIDRKSNRLNLRGVKTPIGVAKLYISEKLPVMFILRGLPGSGKSYLARGVAHESKAMGVDAAVLSSDDFFLDRGVYVYDRNKLSTAHDWNKERAVKCLKEGCPLIVIDNTNTVKWEILPYAVLALKYNYDIQVFEPDTSWKFKVNELARKNCHDVPKDSIKRMKDRYEKFTTEDVLAAAFSSLKTREKMNLESEAKGIAETPVKVDPASRIERRRSGGGRDSSEELRPMQAPVTPLANHDIGLSDWFESKPRRPQRQRTSKTEDSKKGDLNIKSMPKSSEITKEFLNHSLKKAMVSMLKEAQNDRINFTIDNTSASSSNSTESVLFSIPSNKHLQNNVVDLEQHVIEGIPASRTVLSGDKAQPKDIPASGTVLSCDKVQPKNIAMNDNVLSCDKVQSKDIPASDTILSCDKVQPKNIATSDTVLSCDKVQPTSENRKDDTSNVLTMHEKLCSVIEKLESSTGNVLSDERMHHVNEDRKPDSDHLISVNFGHQTIEETGRQTSTPRESRSNQCSPIPSIDSYSSVLDGIYASDSFYTCSEEDFVIEKPVVSDKTQPEILLVGHKGDGGICFNPTSSESYEQREDTHSLEDPETPSTVVDSGELLISVTNLDVNTGLQGLERETAQTNGAALSQQGVLECVTKSSVLFTAPELNKQEEDIPTVYEKVYSGIEKCMEDSPLLVNVEACADEKTPQHRREDGGVYLHSSKTKSILVDYSDSDSDEEEGGESRGVSLERDIEINKVEKSLFTNKLPEEVPSPVVANSLPVLDCSEESSPKRNKKKRVRKGREQGHFLDDSVKNISKEANWSSFAPQLSNVAIDTKDSSSVKSCKEMRSVLSQCDPYFFSVVHRLNSPAFKDHQPVEFTTLREEKILTSSSVSASRESSSYTQVPRREGTTDKSTEMSKNLEQEVVDLETLQSCFPGYSIRQLEDTMAVCGNNLEWVTSHLLDSPAFNYLQEDEDLADPDLTEPVEASSQIATLASLCSNVLKHSHDIDADDLELQVIHAGQSRLQKIETFGKSRLSSLSQDRSVGSDLWLGEFSGAITPEECWEWVATHSQTSPTVHTMQSPLSFTSPTQMDLDVRTPIERKSTPTKSSPASCTSTLPFTNRAPIIQIGRPNKTSELSGHLSDPPSTATPSHSTLREPESGDVQMPRSGQAVMPADFVHSLEALYGSLNVPIAAQGLILDEHIAEKIYKCLKLQSSHHKLIPSTAEQQLKSDEALARALQEAENAENQSHAQVINSTLSRSLPSLGTNTSSVPGWTGQQPQWMSSAGTSDPNGPLVTEMSSHEQATPERRHAHPLSLSETLHNLRGTRQVRRTRFSPYIYMQDMPPNSVWLSGRMKSKTENLHTIMEEERIREERMKEQMRYIQATGDSETLATRIKRTELSQLFPSLSPDFLDDIFINNSYSKEMTIRVLETTYGIKQVPMSKEPRNDGMMREMLRRSVVETKHREPWNATAEEVEHEDHGPALTYDDLRSEAQLYHNLAKECQENASKYRSNGMQGAALFYRQQAKKYKEEESAANHRAAKALFQKGYERLERESVLDLHGYHIDEAIMAVGAAIKLREEETMLPSSKKNHLFVITGRGRKSKNGIPKLKPSISKYLQSHGFRFEEQSAGMLKVYMGQRV